MERISDKLVRFPVPKPWAGVRQFFRAAWLLFFFSIFEPLRKHGMPLSTTDIILPGVSCLVLGAMYQTYLSMDLSRYFRVDVSVKYFYTLAWWAGFIMLLPTVIKAATASVAMVIAYIPEFALLLSIALILTLVFKQGRGLWIKGRLRWFTPIFLLQLGLFTWYPTHFHGNSNAVCQSVLRQHGVTLLTDQNRAGITGHAFPYDAGYDPDAQKWFVTMKERQAGMWSHTDSPTDCSNALLMLDKTGHIIDRECFFAVDDAFMPQNLVIDPTLKVVVIYLVNRHMLHRIAAYSYKNNRLRLVNAKTFFDDEPNALSLDTREHRLFAVLYNQNAVDIWSADLPGFTNPARFRRQTFWAGLDKPVLSADNHKWFVPSHKGMLFTFATSDLHIISSTNYWQPLSSACLANQKLYLTGYMSGSLIQADADTGKPIMSADTERAPRFCSIDNKHDLIFVSGYTPGFLGIHRLSDLVERARLRTGEITRAIHYIPALDRVVAGSSCGLLLIDPQEAVK